MSSISSTWLMPAEEDAGVFEDLVEALSLRFGTPRFKPHLTLLQEREVAADRLADFWRGLAPGQAIAAAVADVEAGPDRFRSLYARIADEGVLGELNRAGSDRFGAEGRFLPHVSLAYGVAESASKQEARALLAANLRGRPLRFDFIRIVASGKDIPIADWTVQHEISLT